jgi:hypothetical protein
MNIKGAGEAARGETVKYNNGADSTERKSGGASKSRIYRSTLHGRRETSPHPGQAKEYETTKLKATTKRHGMFSTQVWKTVDVDWRLEIGEP